MVAGNKNKKKIESPLWPWFLVLGILTFAVFANTLSFGFLENWDDPRYVSGNPWIYGFTWENIKAVFTKEFVGNYAPLHLLSYMIDYTIWELKPFGYHLTNVIFHAVNSILVFLLLFRICKDRLASLVGALLFAVHPVQVESVAWVTERKNILGMFFFLLSFIYYQNYIRTNYRYHYFAAFSLYLAALLTKSVVVIFPPILILYELMLKPQRDRIKQILIRIAPFVLAAGVISVVTVITQKHGGGIRELYGDGVYAHSLTVLSMHLKYLQSLLFPINLSVVYNIPIQTAIFSLRIVVAGIAFGVILAIFLYLYRIKSPVCFWILFYFIALLPVSHIIPIVTQMNDRYLYYPMVGVSGIMAHALSYLRSDQRGKRQKAQAVLKPVVFLLIGIMAFSAYDRNKVWSNGTTLWTDAVAKTPDSANSHAGLGEIYMHKKMLKQSESQFLKSIELDPKQLMPYINVSAIYYQMKRWGDAAVYAEKAVAIDPNNAEARSNLALAYSEAGRLEEALPHLEKAAGLSQDNIGINYNLALLYYETSRFPEAERVLEEILSKDHGNMDDLILLSLFTLSKTYARLGKDWKIEEVYLAAIKSNPDKHLLSYNLACFYATHERPEKAMFQLREALRKGMHDPDLLIKDPDLNTLRARQDFKEILTRMTSPPLRLF